MRLKDLSIGKQLGLGLGVILASVVLLGLMAWDHEESLWRETKGLYDHPFAVRRALGEIKSDVIAMHLGMKSLCLTPGEPERAVILQNIATYEDDAQRQLQIVFDRYLGPRADAEAAAKALALWKSHRQETIRLLLAGRVAEAVERVNSGPAGGPNQQVMAPVGAMITFSNNRATQFYQDAKEHKNALLAQTATAMGVILLLALAVCYYLLRAIRWPLKDLTATALAYRQGQLQARSQYASANEFGALSQTFNALLDRVQEQQQRQHNAAAVAEVMLREEDPGPFCRQLLTTLLVLTGSQAGAVYLLDESGAAFRHFDSVGLGPGARESFSAQNLEGEFGAALATGRVQLVKDLPQDTRFGFAAAGGDFQPRELLTIPIQAGGRVTAVLSLASLPGFAPTALALVEDVLDTLSARLGGVLAFRQVKGLARKLEAQNHEMEAQQKELEAQAVELGQQNVELEIQKRQLDEANRLKSSFLANMSHELRTPLNSVIALAGVLDRRLAGKVASEEHGYLAVIERNGKHLLEMINDILDLSRIEAGREEINLGRFSLRELAAEVTDMLMPQAREKGLELVNSVPEGLPPIRSDLAKCRHILQNLLGNAVKFTEAGRVEMSALVEGQTLRLAVADTGIGIAPEHLPQIFDEFRQADESAARKYGGTGLGLAIARKYAVMLGGGLEATSTPGQGSTFSLWLPLTPDAALLGAAAASSPPAPRAATPARRSGLGRRILVVEDSEPAVIQLRDILHGEGYDLSVARDGRQALQQIQAARPDAVILDLMMPEVDGFQVLKAIRAEANTADLPVLILTAKHVTSQELSFLQGNHIHQLIQKGDISKRQLLEAIARMVAPGPPES